MKFKGKTVEDAIEKALLDLNISKEEVEISILQKPSKRLLGLGNKEAIIDVSLKTAIVKDLLKESNNNENNKKITSLEKNEKINKGIKFLEDILNCLKYSIKCSVIDEGDFVCFDIKGENVKNLIGKRGETLYALQYLLNLAVNNNKKDENNIRFIIDIENFREKREKTLCELAKKLAKKVIETKKEIKLESMPPIERKIIHMSLQDNKEVETISEGQENYRYVKIILKKPH